MYARRLTKKREGRRRRAALQYPETTIRTPSIRRAQGTSLAAIVLAGAAITAAAQEQLPPPSRTIYKCQANGKISYADEPCVGAQRLDTTPTRGVDRLSGKSRIGSEVAGEIRSEQLAQAIRPLTGMTPSQFATASRRHRLSGEAQRECRALESAILESEQAERRARAAMMESIQQDLFILRKRFRRLGC